VRDARMILCLTRYRVRCDLVPRRILFLGEPFLRSCMRRQPPPPRAAVVHVLKRRARHSPRTVLILLSSTHTIVPSH